MGKLQKLLLFLCIIACAFALTGCPGGGDDDDNNDGDNANQINDGEQFIANLANNPDDDDDPININDLDFNFNRNANDDPDPNLVR